MDIYTTEHATVDSVIEQFNALESDVVNGDASKVKQVVLLTETKRRLVEKHGNDQSPGYRKALKELVISKKDQKRATAVARISTQVWRKYTSLGESLAKINDNPLNYSSLGQIQRKLKEHKRSQNAAAQLAEAEPKSNRPTLKDALAAIEEMQKRHAAEVAELKQQNSDLKQQLERDRKAAEDGRQLRGIYEDTVTELKDVKKDIRALVQVVKQLEEDMSNADRSLDKWLDKHGIDKKAIKQLLH